MNLETAINLPGYAVFRRTVLRLTGIDLDQYKSAQLERRLATIMKRCSAADMIEYGRLLEHDPAQLQAFKDFFTINVSEFLRNPEKFDELQLTILPELLRHRPHLRIWSAGCSNGSEPYSVSMVLSELAPHGQHQIIATDLDEQILKAAANGVYQEKDVKNVSPERRTRFFIRTETGWAVHSELKRHITFSRHNLLRDPFPKDLDLVLCRNVVIYFTEEAKDELYRNFHRALRPGGILFVGGTESLLNARNLGFATASPFFYRAVK